jgi:hypothetical protein
MLAVERSVLKKSLLRGKSSLTKEFSALILSLVVGVLMAGVLEAVGISSRAPIMFAVLIAS